MEITSISPVAWQLGVGLQASGIREPKATVDLAQQGRQTAEVASTRVRVEATTQPTSPALPIQDDEKRRRVPYFGRRCRRHQPDPEESTLFQPLKEDTQGYHLDVSV